MSAVLFFIAAIGAIAGAIGVVTLHNPFYSVLALVSHLFALAVLFLLLMAQFVAAENTAENRVSPGERYARIYEINMSRCIFCGYCEIACPFDAITMGHDYEMSDYNRGDLIFTKEMLLADSIERTPLRREGE